jgi:hypothetical protein
LASRIERRQAGIATRPLASIALKPCPAKSCLSATHHPNPYGLTLGRHSFPDAGIGLKARPAKRQMNQDSPALRYKKVRIRQILGRQGISRDFTGNIPTFWVLREESGSK